MQARPGQPQPFGQGNPGFKGQYQHHPHEDHALHAHHAKDATAWQVKMDYIKYVVKQPGFLVVCLVPWLLFTATLLLFTYLYIKIPFLCWIWSFWIVLLGVSGIVYNCISSRPGSFGVPLSSGILVAVLLATVMGLYIYDTAAIFPTFYHNARKYTNVVASEPSAAVADAGKLTFNDQTRVDINKSVGYIEENGMVYCVAPIMGAANQPRIEYWAAGIDCCAASGDFWCDQAKNPEAHGGVVIFDNNGWFIPSRFPLYQKAREKAEAEYMLQSVGYPLFVRWVETDNLDYLSNYYGTRALWNVVGWSLLFLILAALLSFALWQPRTMS